MKMTEETMETSDSVPAEISRSAAELSHLESLVPEQYRSVEENILLVSNAIDPKPMAIHHMAFQQEEKLLAVARFSRKVQSDSVGTQSSIKGSIGKIEIWGTSPLYRLKQTIYLSGEYGSVEGLCWYKSRLFSCGTHGHLVEYDLQNEKIKKWTSVPGGSKWCMALHPESARIVVGSEDGFVVLLQIYEHEVEVEKMLDRQEDRVLCVAWSPDGTRLATGSPNAVRIWDVKSGQAVDRISVGRNKAKEDTIVWCAAFLDDSNFATGDSKGNVCIWDAKMGVCSETHPTKLQQVQCLAVCKDKIYCGGVGKEIQVLLKTQGDYSNAWAVAATRSVHLHDVRALVPVTESELVSGGVDSYLIATNAPPLSINVIPPVSSSDVAIAPLARLIMVRCIDYAAVLHLPEGTSSANMLFRFNTTSPIIAINVSEDGRWCALSTTQTSKLYAMKCNPGSHEKSTAELMMWPSKAYKAFRRIQFSAEPVNMAAVARKDRNIGVLMLSYEMKSVSEMLIIDTTRILHPDASISLMKFADTSLAVTDFDGNVVLCLGVRNIGKQFDWKPLPKHTHEVTALVASPTDPGKLLLFYADGQISEFNIEKFAYKILQEKVEETNEVNAKARGSSLTTACNHNSKDIFFFSTDSSNLLGFNKLNMMLHKEAKGQSLYPGRMEVRLGKFLVNAGHMQNGDICVVNANHENILKKLPILPVTKSLKKYM